MVQDGHSNHPLGVGHIGRLQLRGQLSLPLVAPVLEPYLHLRLGEVQGRGQAGPLRRGQVPLHVEGGLQLEDLAPGEDGAGLLLAPVVLALLAVAVAPSAAGRGCRAGAVAGRGVVGDGAGGERARGAAVGVQEVLGGRGAAGWLTQPWNRGDFIKKTSLAFIIRSIKDQWLEI